MEQRLQDEQVSLAPFLSFPFLSGRIWICGRWDWGRSIESGLMIPKGLVRSSISISIKESKGSHLHAHLPSGDIITRFVSLIHQTTAGPANQSPEMGRRISSFSLLSLPSSSYLALSRRYPIPLPLDLTLLNPPSHLFVRSY